MYFPQPRFLLEPRHTAVLAFGSNQGDRLATFDRACDLLSRRGITILRQSRLYLTRPLPGSGGGQYLNSAVAVHIDRPPRELLHVCQAVERACGRIRRARWQARRLDIDIIFYGREEIDQAGLTVPHAAWRDRDFILAALLDLGAVPPPCSAAESRRFLRNSLASAESSIESVREWPVNCARFAYHSI